MNQIHTEDQRHAQEGSFNMSATSIHGVDT